MSAKDVRKSFCFDKTKCKYLDEIDQDAQASLLSQFIKNKM